VLSDGVLHRLTDGECDAIIAHELAHFATGSLWIHAAVPCISAALAVLSMVLVPTPAALPIFLCVFCGLRRAVSRPIELICDRRAGETIGFDTMISSLSKVHAVHPVRAETLVGFLVYATTTHPHPDVRLAALRSRSRSLQDETVDDDRRLLFKHRLGGVLALVVWIMALVCAYIVGKNERLQWVIWTVCAVVVLSPTAFLLMALRNQLRLNRRRTGIRRSPMVAWLVLLLLVLGLLFMARYARWLSESHSETAASVLILICVPVTLVAILVWARISSRSVKLRSEVECALRERDPARALAIAQTKPKVVRRDPVLRLNLSVARVLSGDRATAIEEVEQLVAGFPRFHAAKFNLSAFLLDVDPERSLRIAEELAVSLPKDPIPPIYAARALRRLGRFAEAEQATQRAIAIDPRNGVARAVAAGIKIGLGEFDAARQLIDEAESFAPGDAFIKVAQAELELACGPVSSAQAAVDAAASAVHANPFTLLDHELRTLRQRLEGLVGSPTPILLFPVTPGIPST
jgi:Zn-dependent protease with chaperone function